MKCWLNYGFDIMGCKIIGQTFEHYAIECVYFEEAFYKIRLVKGKTRKFEYFIQVKSDRNVNQH